MNNWLNYHHLYYFKTIADEGSIVKASKLLKVGQPALSMQLKQLEDRFQKQLFIREKRSLILTTTGKTVYEYAREIFKLGTELVDTVSDVGPNNRTKIQIGIQDCVPKNLVAKLTSYIYKNYEASITIFNGDMSSLSKGLIEHEFDIVMLNESPTVKDKNILFGKRILKSPVVFAGNKDFLHIKKAFPKSMDNAPLILPTSHNKLRHNIEHFFNKKKIVMNTIGEAQDTIVQKNMAIDGSGIIPIMELAILSYIESKKLFILGRPNEIYDEIWLGVAKRKILNPIASRLIDEFSF
ncbi:MAG: LysR family transcriptional regulator [Bacteriovoracaceae bacterium]